MDPLARGSSVGRYLLLGPLGAGGMGAVHLAYDPELDRKVALKVLRGDLLDPHGELRARLLREGQAMARLAHPGVIPVHDVGTVGDQIFLAMEYMDGGTLASFLREKPRGWRETLRLFLLAGRGLAAAHRAGLVHRDFKPENVLVAKDGRVAVTDFGLSRLEGDDEEISNSGVRAARDEARRGRAGAVTFAGALLGSPAYMAPEQMRGGESDARSDLFSFCVALHEALYGVRPYAGETMNQLLEAFRAGRLVEVKNTKGVPARLQRALLQGLRAAPVERPRDMDALLDALEPPPRTWPRWAALGAAILLAGGVVVAQRAAPKPCADIEAQLGGAWDASRRQAARAAFLATGLDYAPGALDSAERALDERAAEWVATGRDSCEATRVRGDQSEELFALRSDCLRDGLLELATLGERFARADAATVRAAADAAQGLSPKGRCQGGPGLRTRSPLSPEARAVRDLLAKAGALLALGAVQEARPLLDRSAHDAASLGDARIEGQALLALALAEHRANEDSAGETAQAAALRAEAGHDDETLVRAWDLLVQIEGAERRHFDDGRRWATYAAAVLERMGGAPRLEAERQRALGHLYAEESRGKEALAALTLAESFYANALPGSRELTDVLRETAAVLSRERRAGDALATLRRRAALLEARLGASHPDAVHARAELAMATR